MNLARFLRLFLFLNWEHEIVSLILFSYFHTL